MRMMAECWSDSSYINIHHHQQKKKSGERYWRWQRRQMTPKPLQIRNETTEQRIEQEIERKRKRVEKIIDNLIGDMEKWTKQKRTQKNEPSDIMRESNAHAHTLTQFFGHQWSTLLFIIITYAYLFHFPFFSLLSRARLQRNSRISAVWIANILKLLLLARYDNANLSNDTLIYILIWKWACARSFVRPFVRLFAHSIRPISQTM